MFLEFGLTAHLLVPPDDLHHLPTDSVEGVETTIRRCPLSRRSQPIREMSETSVMPRVVKELAI